MGIRHPVVVDSVVTGLGCALRARGLDDRDALDRGRRGGLNRGGLLGRLALRLHADGGGGARGRRRTNASTPAYGATRGHEEGAEEHAEGDRLLQSHCVSRLLWRSDREGPKLYVALPGPVNDEPRTIDLAQKASPRRVDGGAPNLIQTGCSRPSAW